MARRNFEKTRQSGRPKEPISPREEKVKGPWTHKARGEVKLYTPDEVEQLKKERGWK